MDLLIVNNHFKRVGFLHSKALVSAAGILPDTFGKDVLGLPAEFYLKGDVLLLQLRSRVRQGHSKELLAEIKTLNDKYLFREVIFVGSLTFGYSSRPDNEISTKQSVYHYVEGKTTLMLDDSLALKNLLHEGEEIEEYLENGGLCDEAKEVLENVTFFLTFANPAWDPLSGLVLAQHLRKTLPYK